MNAKMAEAGATLSFHDAHKSFVQISDDVQIELENVGNALKEAFPALATAQSKQQQFRAKHEDSLKQARDVFRIPDTCKRKRTKTATNKIGEAWGKSRVPNTPPRLEELVKYKQAVDENRKEIDDEKAKN